jgi:hypothetical protein
VRVFRQSRPCLQTEFTPWFWDLQLHPADHSVRPSLSSSKGEGTDGLRCVWLPRRAGLLCHEQCMHGVEVWNEQCACVTSPPLRLPLLLFLGIICMRQPAEFGYLCRSWPAACRTPARSMRDRLKLNAGRLAPARVSGAPPESGITRRSEEEDVTAKACQLHGIACSRTPPA